MAEKKQKQERTKPDVSAIIAIVVAIVAFLAILFGVLWGCGVFGKNESDGTPAGDEVKITITIEVNGGTGSYNDMTFELDENNAYTFTDEEIAAIKEALQKDGYELKGLSTTPDGEGGWKVTIPKDAKSPVTLYAIWEEKEPAPELTVFTHENGAITGLTDYGKTLTAIVIPTTLDGEDITSIGSNAFKNNETVTSVTIPEGITGIGEGAFSGCTGLTSIKIPDGVTGISHDAFAQCSGLTSIEIPSSLTNVGHGTFYGCPLTAVYFNGTGDDWHVYIDNSAASNGKFTTEIVFYYSATEPTEDGRFWYSENGVYKVWVVITYHNGDEVEYISYTLGAGESGIEKRVLPGDADEKFVGWFEEDADEEFDYSSVTAGNYVLYAKWHDFITIDGQTYEVAKIDGYPIHGYDEAMPGHEDEPNKLNINNLWLYAPDGTQIVALNDIKDQLTIVIDREENFLNYRLGYYDVTISFGKHTRYDYTISIEPSAE